MENKEYKQYHGYNYKLKGLARALRKNMTKEESKLWYEFLREYSVKFYRQRSIDRYIADFYCSKAGLVIEIDGNQHYTDGGMEYDEIRTNIIEKYRLEVVRFSNNDIKENFYGVCTIIDNKVKERLTKRR